MLKKIAAMMCFSALVGCDYVGECLQGDKFSKERAEKEYRAAMEDYQAGRLDKAVERLQTVCEKDPTNVSARFQLGCLLQDYGKGGEKDYLGAVCAYREYLLQAPNSEKATLAKDRIKICERALAEQMAEKFGINAVADELRESNKLREDIKKAEVARKKLEKDIQEMMQRNKKLNEELTRYKSYMPERVTIADEPNEGASEVAEAKKLLSDADAEPEGMLREVADAKKLREEVEEGPTVPQEIAEAKRQLAEEPEPEAAVIQQAVDAKEKREAAEAAQKAAKEKARAEQIAKMPKVEPRPDKYVMKKGESLSDVALRFYGNKRYWKHIRDANKTKISTDGRVKAGTEIIIPPPK